jgi:hypothetical protein
MNDSNAVTQTTPSFASEVRRAIDAVNLPEVQAIIKELAVYGLGVYAPHMHTREQAFAVLPDDMIQVEREQIVTWERRDHDVADQGIPVAWRWEGEGATASAECIQTCSWNAEKGTRYKDHL